MKWRRWLTLTAIALVVVLVAARLALPELIRQVAIARITAMAERPASIQGVDINLLRGRLALRGFRLAERGDPAPFAEFERLDVHLHFPSLLRGHLRIRELILHRPTVRVIRFNTSEFNFSDLIQRSGGGGPLDLTVDRFVLVGGTATLEDRALPEPRTWTSERIAIEAGNLSTRRDDGWAEGTSITGGAPLSVRLERLRLYPIHLRATVAVEGLDLTLARVYVPPETPVVPDRGRLTTSVGVTLDAREGLRLDATGRLEDVGLVRPDGTPAGFAPRMEAQLRGLTLAPGGGGLVHLEAAGSALLPDPTVRSALRFLPVSVRAVVDDLTWPLAGSSARVELVANARGRGSLTVTGTVRPPTVPSELRLRVVDFDLAPWVALLTPSPRLTGVARGDLRVSEPLRVGMPARVRGFLGVHRLRIVDGDRTLLEARRVAANDLELEWPARLAIRRVVVEQPRALVERDRAGTFPVWALWRESPQSRPAPSDAAPGPAPASATPPFGVGLGDIVVQDGAIDWRDEAVVPRARLDVSRLQATVTGVGWPLRGPVNIRASFRPPGGGQVRVAGRVTLDPVSGEARVTAQDTDLAPYQAYLPTTARIAGSADLDARVVLSEAGSLAARGRAGLSRLDVRDGQRTVMRIERATASDFEAEWPQRVSIRRLTARAPWILVERDETGAFPLPGLLRAAAGGLAPSPDRNAGGAMAVRVEQLTVEDGGARVVDRSVSPAFAVDLERAGLRVEGLSTTPAGPARLDMKGQLVRGATLTLNGTIGPIGGPLRVDLQGELRGFAVPRTNSYLVRYVAWSARQGTLTTTFQCRVQGDALDAKTDIRLSRLQVARAAADDETQARVGLPLGLIVALMKDARGDIHVTLPVGGRLNDPRFDFREAIWSAVRAVAVKAITLPVSWIGRLQVGPDSRIEDIQIDPVRFEPGTATPTAEGRGQATRLAAFLGQLSEVRLTLTPLVSARDLAVLQRQAVEAAIDRLARKGLLSPEEAAARLYTERFGGQSPPDSLHTIRAALVEAEPAPTEQARALATGRTEALRSLLTQAGIAPGRLSDGPLPERLDAEEGIAPGLLEPDLPQRSRLAEALRRVGATITGREPVEE